MKKLDPGDLRRIELTVPASQMIDGHEYPIHDGMRPGSAFCIDCHDERRDQPTTHLYIRSNCSIKEHGHLETIITDTHDESDSWSWWHTRGVQEGDTIGVRVEADTRGRALKIHESRRLALEPDSWWSEQDFVAIAFSTGIAPFLAQIRYMAPFQFGRAFNRFGRGAHYVLVVSMKEPRQLICHEELLALEDRFPENFRYHPALTREWSDDWPYTRKRVIRMERDGKIDLSPLLDVVPDIQRRHVRICGGKMAIDQLVKGFLDYKISPSSLRAEVS